MSWLSREANAAGKEVSALEPGRTSSSAGKGWNRKLEEEKNLRFWTNIALTVAVTIGIAMAVGHGGAFSASLTAFGAALGLGGVLGFLFGVPGSSRAPVNIFRADNLAVGTGDHSSAVGKEATGGPSNQTPAPAGGPTATPTEAAHSAPSISASTNRPPHDGSSNLQPKPAPQNPAAPDHTSNLEQVADWVTKLLLGGGLTQMQRIPPKIWQWSRVVALGILRDEPQQNEQMIQAHQAFAAGLLVYGFILGFFAGFLITRLALRQAIAE